MIYKEIIQINIPTHLKDKELQLRPLENEEDASAQRGDYERATEMRSERLRRREQYDAEKAEALKGKSSEMAVSAEDIGNLIMSWTGIPVDRLLESEADRLLHMEDRIHERVIGQGAADGRAIERAGEMTRKHLPKAPPPEVAAKCIERALRARRPRARYTVGDSALTVPLSRRLLPDRLILALIRRHYGL